jgi:RNA polymerase sigma-70 factor (ECF subfamily)
VERESDHVTDAVLSGEDRRRVAACMGGLTDIQRECIELAYYQGLTYVQVSERLAANLATVKSRMRDALRGLRNCLGVR